MKRLFKDSKWDKETEMMCEGVISLLRDRAKTLSATHNAFDVENLFHQAVTDLMLEIRLDLKYGESSIAKRV